MAAQPDNSLLQDVGTSRMIGITKRDASASVARDSFPAPAFYGSIILADVEAYDEGLSTDGDVKPLVQKSGGCDSATPD
jgi:hypothetical protein